ncbi:hypothetical protein [Promicromonospora panici]|uniref:hypothetical protein n=1 Tax=Promicromonospora panici TaxID=2219658 RepID=UPI00101CCAF0|nr:hypothetical protein [Promicromonospora panici]
MAEKRQLPVHRVGADGRRRTGSDGDERDFGPMARVLPTKILDERVLHELTEDLGKPAADRLVEQYGDGLKQRLEVLTAATFDRRLCLVYDTAMDLAVTGATVGATALAEAARTVAQNAVRYHTRPEVEALERLMRLAHDTEAALVRHLRT